MLAGGALLSRVLRAWCLAGAALASCTFPDLRLTTDAAVDVPVVVDVSAVVDAPAPAPTPSCPLPTEHGCERVIVEGGTFTLGGEGRNGPSQPGVSVDDFVLDATEVTVRRYRRFVAAVDAGQVAGRLVVDYPPPGRSHFVVDTVGLGGRVGSDVACNWSPEARGDRDDQPINCVNWFGAMAFCIWDGGRLPTEAELEYAARWWRAGETPRTFPWGPQQPDCTHTQWRAGDPGGCPGDDGLTTRRVGSLAAGAVFGLLDLAGNVTEWCADEFVAYASAAAPNECWGRGPVRNPVCRSMAATDHTARGGSWTNHADESTQLQTVAREAVMARSALPTRGLRCARAR